MKTKLDNPQAFPTNVSHGMTLRDWFAGQAMDACLHNLIKAKETPKQCTEIFARNAYLAADAMLAEREKGEALQEPVSQPEPEKVKKFTWVAVIDDQTCPHCAYMNGRTVREDSTILPPMPQCVNEKGEGKCRCVLKEKK